MRSYQVVAGQNVNAQQLDLVRADAAGAGSLLVHQQLGAIALPTNPSNTQTLTLDINGTNVVITFVSSIGAVAGNVLIGASAAATCANLVALLNQPQTTTATGVALSSANQTLVGYLSWPLSGTTITPCSNNSTLYAPETSFSASTTATGGSYTAQTMQLYVEPGVFYIAGTRVIFAGASTPTVTAPSSHPRIDVLSINSSGTLSWTAGSENVSPTAPTYPNPASNLVLCELYNVTGETQLLDNASQSAAQGYVSNDVRTFQQPSLNWGAFPTDLIPDGDGTRNFGGASFEWNNGYFKGSVFVNGTALAGRFGGTGADGALSHSSGNTNIDCANAAIVIKNYTSISITGTASITFINPHANGTIVILKSQAAVTITSSATPAIDASGLGAAGATNGTTGAGSAGNNPNSNFMSASGMTGGGGTTGSPPTGGSAGAALPLLVGPGSAIVGKFVPLCCGAGGGAGAGSGGTGGNGGNGGNGGGALYIECGGALNFTTGSISVAGKTGTAGTTDGGGGGGGGGGTFVLLYASLTANSGTVTVTAGAGGAAGSGAGSPAGGGGGGGASISNAGTAGASTSTGGAGGAGGTGKSLIAANADFS